MSTSLEPSSSTSWRKRTREDLALDIKDAKRQKYIHYRLESESSRTSDDGTESIYSVQGKETDVVKDTSDTESHSSEHVEEYDLEFEYEVASLSENEDCEVSTSDSDNMMIVAAAAVICDSTLEAWITDGEDSDSTSDETSFRRTDFSVCVQCKGENLHPQYRYCEKCFQSCGRCKKRQFYKCFPLCQSCFKARKRIFPPRPRRNRRRKIQAKLPQKEEDNPVELDTLKSCLSGLSQDSGIGSSQECPSLGMDQIVIPEHLKSSSSAGTTKTEDITPALSNSLVTSTGEYSEFDSNSQPSTSTQGEQSLLKRKRQRSDSSLSSICEAKRLKFTPKLEQMTSDLGSEVSSTSSRASTSSGSIASQRSTNFEPDIADTEPCIICNNAKKDGVFLHTNQVHRCCCYPCAKKTWKIYKRCPICNMPVNNVVKMFTT